jgi:flavin reductase (DIM6/NTAB) family NADH-FMN oxidoreductase RutF
MLLNKEDIEHLESRYRGLFINALSGIKAAHLIGTCDQHNRSNLAIFTSVFHIGSHPPLLGMITRPHSVARHTLENILQTEHYSINHVNESIYQQAHQTSARYDRDTSEFKAVGLTEQWYEEFPAPFVEQSRIQLGMELREHHHLAINNTDMLIGEISYINIKDDIVSDDGYVAVGRAESVLVSSLDTYHSSDLLSRLSYAKPGTTTLEPTAKLSATIKK